MNSQGPENFVNGLMRACSYPAILMLGFALLISLQSVGVGAVFASYTAVVVGAICIALHETVLPCRENWKPDLSDISVDASFMLTVQFALPYLLSMSVVFVASSASLFDALNLSSVWPHELPVFLQAALMLLAADFPRYWMHRAFHKLPILWRLHAVHHSPSRLYWLNVGRFHPIEKAIQYSVDALPFVVLGVSDDVLAAYFVFYGINGFFQHSNCSVRLGPLNYIVSGPELHRWHHSKLPSESDNNFGNNLIIWDIIFGTRFLPKSRDVGPLGLKTPGFPKNFWGQMKEPFTSRRDGA